MGTKKMTKHIFPLKWLCVLLLFGLVFKIQAVNQEDTKISNNRDANRANICGYYSASYSLQQRQKSKVSVQQYNYLSDEEIEKIISQKKYAFDSLTVLITMPFIVCAAILLIMIAPLLCCCAWPEKYPVCKTWRKPENQLYTKCELKWPAYLTVILYITVGIGGIIGAIQGPNIIKKYNDWGCKNAAIFDDILNGRVSGRSYDKFFVGLSPLSDQLDTFNDTKLSTFFSDSSNSLSTANQVRTKQTTVETTIQSTYSGYSNSVYSNAFSSDGTTYADVKSAFKSMHLGPSSDNTKILGIIKSKLNVIYLEVNEALDDMILAFNQLQTTTESGVRLQIGSFKSAVSNFKSSVQLYLNQIGNQFYNNELYDKLYALLGAYYGIVFAFAILGLLASILVTFCTVVRARLILYFICGFLIFLALVGFAFLIYLVYMYPQMNQICQYVDKKLNSGTQTQTLLQTLGYPQFANKVSACMADGSGKLIDSFDTQFSDTFDQINVIAQGTQTFNNKIPSFSQENIDDPFDTVYSTIFSVKNAKLWEISDTMAINHVNKVFAKNYPLGPTCNSVAINGDVWMPSFNLYTCPAGKFKMPVCSDLSSQAICPLGCYEILNEFVSPSGDPSFGSTLASRYDTSSGTTCNYYQYIIRLHNNWNLIRMSKMDVITGEIDSLKLLADDYATKVNSVKASLGSFKTTLEANLNSMTNLTSGSFNGMDCTVIGESIWEFRDSFCVGLVQSVRYNIICLCLICFGTLLMACFVTCTGVRHLKHLEKLQLHTGYKGKPIQLSNTTILQK